MDLHLKSISVNIVMRQRLKKGSITNDRKRIYVLAARFFELSGATTLNEDQVKIIKEHIALVMKKVTPSTVLPLPSFPNLPYIPPTTTGDKITIPLPKIGGYEIICSTAEPIKDIPTALSC